MVIKVLLALRTLSTSLTLGSIRLYQSTATSLLSSVKTFTQTLELSFQSIFYLAAFVEASTDPDRIEAAVQHMRYTGNLINYEDERIQGGMMIEAKGMGFVYPGSEKPVLRDINLTIRPGETLGRSASDIDPVLICLKPS
jgi:ABC-type multidrug transport system fused ATPase/permease subunit